MGEAGIDCAGLVEAPAPLVAEFWEFEENGREFEVSVALIANDVELVLRSHEWIEGWLAEGRVVRVLERYSPRFPGMYLYYPSRRQQPPALRAFIECLLDRDA